MAPAVCRAQPASGSWPRVQPGPGPAFSPGPGPAFSLPPGQGGWEKQEGERTVWDPEPAPGGGDKEAHQTLHWGFGEDAEQRVRARLPGF